ncbi:hypothetical protein D3C71_1931580 [compost metagenome]
MPEPSAECSDASEAEPETDWAPAVICEMPSAMPRIDSKPRSTLSTWLPAPEATSEIDSAICSVAWEVCSELAVNCWDDAANCMDSSLISVSRVRRESAIRLKLVPSLPISS